MNTKAILIVDDEKNIRLTLSQSLEPLGIPLHTAVNGEEAMQWLQKQGFLLVLLDLKMPGENGMDTLRHIKLQWPKTQVIIITAHGTIEIAVEAMRLGAVDFIQKPFSPAEIRDLTKKVLQRAQLDASKPQDYPSLVELAKRAITEHNLFAAQDFTRQAIALNPARPEAYNLLGALTEIDGNKAEAEKFYRAALDIDAAYTPAQANLERSTGYKDRGGIQLETPKKGIQLTNPEALRDPDEF